MFQFRGLRFYILWSVLILLHRCSRLQINNSPAGLWPMRGQWYNNKIAFHAKYCAASDNVSLRLCCRFARSTSVRFNSTSCTRAEFHHVLVLRDSVIWTFMRVISHNLRLAPNFCLPRDYHDAVNYSLFVSHFRGMNCSAIGMCRVFEVV